jgi:hypothetical protein
MFQSYDHLQAEINTSEIKTTDNRSVVFRILVNLVDDGDRFLAPRLRWMELHLYIHSSYVINAWHLIKPKWELSL